MVILSASIIMIRNTLSIIFLLVLLSCQSQEANNQAAPDPAAQDTIAIAQAPQPAPLDSAYLIVPGKSIGQIQLNMPARQVNLILGKADSGDAAMGKALSFWLSKQATGQPQHYVAVYTVTDFGGKKDLPKVQQVQVTSPQFQTAKGIGTGKPLSAIRKHFSNIRPIAYYQNALQQQVYIYDDQEQGIAFEVALPDSLCTAVTIHPKGENMADIYLPLHPDITRLEQP